MTQPSTKKASRKRLFRMRQRRYMKRGLRLVPNMFTLGNAFFGFCSLVLAAHGEPAMSAYFILLGALLDALDGRMARLMGVCSPFGVQLDSLCDFLSFIIAPAFLAYMAELKMFGIFGFAVSSVFVLAGVIRLARFNITNEEQTVFFLGVPSTIAGCFIASSLIMLQFNPRLHIFSVLMPFCIVILAYLMISSLRFPTFKHLSKKSYIWASIFIVGCIVSMGLINVLFSLFLLYFVWGFTTSFTNKLTKYRTHKAVKLK